MYDYSSVSRKKRTVIQIFRNKSFAIVTNTGTTFIKSKNLVNVVSMSSINHLIEGLNYIPKHWLIVPTKMKKPLGLNWNKNPYLPNELQKNLANNSKLKVLTKYGWQNIEPTGFGLKCGANSKEFLIAIDCDGIEAYRQILAIKKGVSIDKFQSIKDANRLVKMAEMYLPITVTFSSGRMNRKQFLYKEEL